MKVRDFVKDVNKSLNVNLGRVYEIKKKYLSLYRSYMILLYDEGFISDPTCFNEREVRENIKDFKITGLIRNSGMVCLESHQVGFALCKKDLSEDGRKFLSILERVLYYRERSSDIDKFYDKQYPFKNSFTIGMSMSGPRIFLKKSYPMSESIMECFYQEKTKGKVVKRKYFYDKIFYEALNELGLMGNKDDGLFVKGFTRSEEIEYCDLILDGHVSLNGSKAGVLEKWLKEHAWNTDIEDKYISQKLGLFTYIETQKTDFMLKNQNDLLNETIEECGLENTICVSTDCIFYTVEEEEIPLPVSSFILYSGEEDVISCDDRNVLEGYTGEVYPIDYFSEDSHTTGIYVGCPIEIYKPDSNEKVLVVDLEQTTYYSPGKKNVSWFSYEDASITFERSIYQKGVFEEGSLEDALFKIYGESENGRAIGKIPRSLVKSKADLEKAKEKVFKTVIADGRLKERREALVYLEKGLTKEAYSILRKEFSEKQLSILTSAFEKGLNFDQVWALANPVLTCKAMKELLKDVVKE